jgi:hypothetical protein
MANKLVERYSEIDTELDEVRQVLTTQITDEAVRARMADLKAKQADLKKTLQHLIALSKIRDEAWQALSYGANVQESTQAQSKKEKTKMFKKFAFGLIVVGMMVVGIGSFTGMTARAAAPDCGSDSVMLANNPELKVICSNLGIENETQVQRAIEASAARYTGLAGYHTGAEGTTNSTFLAANPELNVVERYVTTDEITDSEWQVQRAIEASAARYAGLAGHYTGDEGTTNSTFLAANPELSVVDRYVTAAEVTDSEWQAANPELMTVSRYQAQVEWQRKHFPGR